MDHEYVAVDCPTENAVVHVVDRIRTGELAGANVTVPWKRLALSLADSADLSASETGAANVLLRRGSQIVAFNTDTAALRQEVLQGVARCIGNGARPKLACIIGGGGAARAAALACQLAGASSVVVTARRWAQRIPETEWELADDFRRLGALPVAWSSAADTSSEWSRACAQADVIVQATSAGMLGGPDGAEVASRVPWQTTRATVFAYDVVYNPACTPFFLAAESGNRHASTGLGMLVGQAAEAFTLWLDTPAPLHHMREAAEIAIFGRRDTAFTSQKSAT
jgi:shikimate dehydrogenase